MAKTDFPLSINRRRLLISAATVTATGILPDVKLADAAAADVLRPSPLTPKAEPANFCAATARRLLEIARRNEIRREAKLPLLPIAKELRRIKRQEELVEFERFEAVHGKAVWQEVLKPRREAEGNLNWRPSWMEGVRYQTQMNKILWEKFYAARRVANLPARRTLLKSPAALKRRSSNPRAHARRESSDGPAYRGRRVRTLAESKPALRSGVLRSAVADFFAQEKSVGARFR
jgi:hypothetical protein